MDSGRQLYLVVAAALASTAATHRTPNFTVSAPNEQIARQAGEYAEKYRKEKALQWLGKEMPQWGQPCPLKVTITMNGPSGFTTFGFDRGAIVHQEMQVEGSLERVLNSVLPHEITHTVFAYHFRCALPRWADEGGSVLSEDEAERQRHDKLVRECLAGGKAFRLRVLFDMKQYPGSGGDVLTLYAQGYSVSRFLVESGSRQQFLNFVADGMRHGWDRAVQTHYRMNRLEDLEESWLNWMRGTYNAAPALLTKNTKPAAERGTDSIPEMTPIKVPPLPVVRGAAPDEEPTRPGAYRPIETTSREGWSPVAPPSSRPSSPVQLLPPVPGR